MANLIRSGTTPVWGIPETAATAAPELALISDLSIDSSFREQEITNHQGQPCGWLASYQDLKGSFSAQIPYDEETASAGAGIPAAVSGLASSPVKTLSALPFAAAVTAFMNSNFFDTAATDTTVIYNSTSVTMSAGAAASFSTNYTVYQWADAFGV